jgi:hypothetical protein
MAFHVTIRVWWQQYCHKTSLDWIGIFGAVAAGEKKSNH